MSIWTLLDMAACATPDRCAIVWGDSRLSYEDLRQMSLSLARQVRAGGSSHVVYMGANHPAFAVAVFGAAAAGVPLLPLNYRLGDAQLSAALAALARPMLLGDATSAERLRRLGWQCALAADWIGVALQVPQEQDIELGEAASDSVAILLQTSGTSSAPKSAVLRHSHVSSYIFTNMDFGSAEASEMALVSVPPYHIAGVSNLLSNIYATRTIAYLDNFSATQWLHVARTQRVSQAMLVPTMLARIVDELKILDGNPELDSLRTVSYGGAALARNVVELALKLLPHVDFVNAYGLTETSSTIAMLGPQDHRAALASPQEHVRARLGSAGRPLEGIELDIRDEAGASLAAGSSGMLWVRGPQVSGEYLGSETALDPLGWFNTRDKAHLDPDGYLFIEGRHDDTIIRGGENIAPAEIEEVLLTHPGVLEAAVAGIADPQWGQRIVAAVVLRSGHHPSTEELRSFVRGVVRSARTPDCIALWPQLPYTSTGKLLRRQVAEAFRSTDAAVETEETQGP